MVSYFEMSKQTIVSVIEFVKGEYSKSSTRFGFVGYRDLEHGDKRLVIEKFTKDSELIKNLVGS